MTPSVTVMDLYIADRYRLTSRIAGGGMGEVWRGRDERLNRDIAVKLLRPEHAESAEFRARLKTEAQSAASISSPRVVEVYDWGEERDDAGRWRSFIVMELVDGDTVSGLLAREATLPPGRVAQLVEDTATALAEAHARGVIHRDIKPANLLIGPDGRIKVADFGIARAKDATKLTATGTLLGTATYLSPEQVEGRPLTPASDVFSLGVVAYQCLTGRPPFVAEGEIATALARLQQTAEPLPATVPTALADLVTAMLATNPDVRPTAELIARTAHGMTTDPAPTRVMPIAESARTTRLLLPAVPQQPSRYRRSLLLAVIAGVIVVAGLLGVSGVFGHSGPTGGATHPPAPRVTASSTQAQPVSSHPAIARKTPPTPPAHVPPGHANGHGPKKNKPGHGHNHGPGPKK